MINLKPCPFCGTTPTYDEDDTVGSMISCRVCKCDGPWAKGQGSHVSIERWNTRVSASDTLEDVIIKWLKDPVNVEIMARSIKEAGK